MSNDIGDWYRSIPQVSRYWFTGTVVLPMIGKLGLVSPISMVLLWEPLVRHFQIWRPVTALFYYPITPQTGFHFLINLYFLYSYSTRLETGFFDGRPADYMFMLIFNWICLVDKNAYLEDIKWHEKYFLTIGTIIGLLAEIMLLMDPMVLSVLYVWCQLNKDTIVQFWFGTQFKAMYLPWVLVAFNIIIRGGGLNELVGILVGHLYFFLMFKYPQDFGGVQLLNTPQILYKYLPNRRGGVSGFGQAPASRRQQQNGDDDTRRRHAWGQGQQLGN